MRNATSSTRSRRSRVFLASIAFSIVGTIAATLMLWSDWRSRAAGIETRPPFVEEPVSFESGKNHLAGVLWRPTTPGPHPAVLFVTGSGGTDRTNHGVIPPLAQRLATQGIACLSWDRPGVDRSSGDHASQTIPDRVEEVAAALRFVKERPEIDRDRIGVFGLGQGGTVAPLAASQWDCAFLIDVSGNQVLGWEQELYRLEHELRADGFHPTLIAEALEVARLKVEVMHGNGAFEEFFETQKGLIGRPWFEYVRYWERARFEVEKQIANYDPAPSWERIRCPVLAIYGGKDNTLPVDASLQVLRKGLATAGNRELTVKVFPKADHLITVSETGGRKEALERARRRPAGSGLDFAPGFVDTVSGWLAARVGRRG